MTTKTTESVKEKAIVQKMLVRLLPLILICYIIAQLDRVNIGFAALQMNAELALTAEVFGLLSGIFFIGYFFFEVPSNMIMSKVGAKMWISRIMITWGIVVVLTGFAQSATHLYILRFLLGVAEAGFLPGILLYLTYWFRERERGRATAILLLAIPVGNLIGAPVSAWIIENVSALDLAGWRWMFILEGIPAVILGIVVLMILPNRPQNAKFLTASEKQWVQQVLDKEQEEVAKVNVTSKKEMFKDFKVWKLSLIYFANYTCMYGISFWMPQIIKNLSETTTTMQIGWLAMLPPLIGIPAILFVGWNSDRTGKYKMHLVVCCIITCIGFFFSSFATTPAFIITVITLTCIGLYGFAGCFFAFMTQFFTKSTAPVGIALVNSFAALGGFVGPTLLGIFTLKNGMLFLSAITLVGTVLLLTLKVREIHRVKQAENEQTLESPIVETIKE